MVVLRLIKLRIIYSMFASIFDKIDDVDGIRI